ncbi:MAG: hypothetical protein AYL30_005980 [Candidatus Hecatellales archaeon B24]|nr:MAG: hypothetical protein AYL30_005980 [Candidatus Hecatellales archaeon B24]
MKRDEPRFLVDGMLGSLARWLRMLGYDVEYKSEWEDERLLKEAARSGRVLLTGDLELYRRASRKALRAYLVKVGDRDEALHKLSERFRLRLTLNPKLSRCPLCNTPLKPVGKREAEGKVPPSVLRRKRRFWICRNPGCGKIYWKGSHWDKIKDTLRKVSDRRG